MIVWSLREANGCIKNKKLGATKTPPGVWMAADVCGSYWIRTSGPLLVRQML